MSRKTENTGFICVYCGAYVKPLTNGSYRNHCPFCLYSLHVDKAPGDRRNECGGLMQPISIVFNAKKGYQIKHRCIKCGFERVNIIAEETEMPDNFELILKLMKSNYSKR